jgi:AAA domain
VGLTTFSGDPKSGKSWAAISIACAVASNTQVFDGFEVATPGSVLYLALEDTAPRIQKRLKALGLPAPPKLSFAFARDVRQGDDGCAMVEHWCREHADAKLIIIDTLQRFRTPTSGRQNAYEADYAAIGAIKQIADKYTVGIMLIHHLRKGGSDDAFARVSGSTAITGAADANIVLLRDRGTGEAIWHITGRDIEDMEVAMKFDGGQWTVLGDAAHHRASQAEQAVIAALQAIGEPATPKEIGEYLGRKIGSRQLLRMREAGLVEWQPGGKYHVTNKAATDKPRKF